MFVRYITKLNMFIVAEGLGYKVLLCAIGKSLNFKSLWDLYYQEINGCSVTGQRKSIE